MRKIKLGIETTADDTGKFAESETTIEGSSMELIKAWCYLSYSLVKTVGIPAQTLFVIGATSESIVKGSVEKITAIDMSKLKNMDKRGE